MTTPRVVARRPELPDPGLGPGARRQPPARHASGIGLDRCCCGCCLVDRDRCSRCSPRPRGLSIVTERVGCPTGCALAAPLPLLLAQGLLIAYAVLWAVLTIDTLRLVSPRQDRAGPRASRSPLVARRAAGRRAAAAATYPSNAVGTTRHSGRDLRGERPGGASRPTATTTSCCWAPTAVRAATRCGSTASRWCRSTPRRARPRSPASRATCPTSPSRRGPCRTRYPNGHEGHADPTAGGGAASISSAPRSRSARTAATLYPDAEANGSAEPGIEATEGRRRGDPRHRDPRTTSSSTCTASRSLWMPRRRRHQRRRAPAEGRPPDRRTKASRSTDWAIGLDRGRASSTWTATPPSGTPVRATHERFRPHGASARCCSRRSSPSSRRRRSSRASRTSRRPAPTSSRPTCPSRCIPYARGPRR